MISRVVPRPEPDPLAIIAEDYNEWTARGETFRGDKPAALEALELVDNQSARLERKLFIHNGGHAICGYLGFHRGHRYIHEAVADPEVARHVIAALDELGEVVRRKWGFSAESIDEYKQDLCRRGAVPEMRDEVLRVVRDPIRKLSPRERLVGPVILAVEYGLPHPAIVQGDRRGTAVSASARSAIRGTVRATIAAGAGKSAGGRLRHRRRNSFGDGNRPSLAAMGRLSRVGSSTPPAVQSPRLSPRRGTPSAGGCRENIGQEKGDCPRPSFAWCPPERPEGGHRRAALVVAQMGGLSPFPPLREGGFLLVPLCYSCDNTGFLFGSPDSSTRPIGKVRDLAA